MAGDQRVLSVALVGPFPLDHRPYVGGVEASFVGLVQALSRMHDLRIVVLTFSPDAAVPTRRTVAGVDVVVLPASRRFNNLLRFRRQRVALRRALQELAPDVVHAQDAIAHGFVCLREAQGGPVVVSVHGIAREERRSLPRRLDRVRNAVGASRLERYCVRTAEVLVQPTRYAERYFGAELRGRIVDVGNPVADVFFAERPEPVRGRIVYSGAVLRRKRLVDLIEAVAIVRRDLPETHLRVVGAESDPAYASDARRRIAELGLEGGAVEFVGPLGREDVAAEYRRASIVVLPSSQETSPMAIGEAMAVGVPVVATRVGGVPDLVEDHVTGILVDVGDVGGLAAVLAELLPNDALRAALGTAARSAARDRFTGAVVAQRVRAVYAAALDGVDDSEVG